MEKVDRNLYDKGQRDGGTGQHATVLFTDPVRHVATVLAAGNRVLKEIPSLQAAGADGEGDFSVPMPGWRARISKELGIPAIGQIVPGPTYLNPVPEHDSYGNEINTWLALTGTQKLYRGIASSQMNWRSNRPTDLIAGDWGHRSAEGATVYALRGGVAGVKVSDLCQLLLDSVDDLARLCGRNIDVFSDWGSMQLINDNGKTRYVIKGNALAGDTYGDRYAYEASIGDGDNFSSLVIRDKKLEKVVYSTTIDQHGNRHVFMAGDSLTEIHGSEGKGITGDQKLVVGGSQDIEVDVESTLKCPKVHIGGRGGERAPMGVQLTEYLKSVKNFVDTQMMVQTPFGPSMPGVLSTGFPFPPVPDFLSNVVDYVKDPT